MPLITVGSALGWLFEAISFILKEICGRDLCVLVIMVNSYQELAVFQTLFLALCKY